MGWKKSSDRMSQFKPGDIVVHKTNEWLRMTIIKLSEDGENATCEWMDKSGIRHKEEFLVVTLIPPPEPIMPSFGAREAGQRPRRQR